MCAILVPQQQETLNSPFWRLIGSHQVTKDKDQVVFFVARTEICVGMAVPRTSSLAGAATAACAVWSCA